jgi:hypothetical protein
MILSYVNRPDLDEYFKKREALRKDGGEAVKRTAGNVRGFPSG